MFIRFGVIPIGRVRVWDCEHIETDFFFFGLPLVPMKSFFVSTRRREREEIQRHRTSVLLGYLRYWLGVPLLAVGLLLCVLSFMVFGVSSSPIFLWCLGISLCSLLTWSWLTFYAGRASSDERRKRSTFSRELGSGLLPTFATRNATIQMLGELSDRWRKLHGREPWRSKLKMSGRVPRAEWDLLRCLAACDAALNPHDDNATYRVTVAWGRGDPEQGSI